MEWFWDVLKCEPTKEIYKVKQAYVNQVREYKKLEIKGERATDAYERLAEAEQAAIAFIEGQDRSTEPKIGQSGTSEKSPEIQSRMQPKETSSEAVKEKPAIPKKNGVAEKIEKSKAEKITKEIEKVTKSLKPELIKQASDSEKQELSRLAQAVKEVKKAKEKLSAPAPQSQTVSEDKGSSQPKRPVAVLAVDEIRALLNDWPRKVILAEWQTILSEKRRWDRGTFAEIRDNSLPLLAPQLHLIPKAIWHYLSEELELTQVELTGKTNWFYAIDHLPDFSFELALYLPEEECTTYFNQRYELYQTIMLEDWSSRRMAIDEQIAYFMTTDDWRADYDVVDQDVLNLIAAYHLKTNIELFVKDPKAPWFDETLLLPLNAPLTAEKNQTAKYLRILFTTYRQHSLSTEHGVFIENKAHNYFDEDLHELLVGLAYYTLNDSVKTMKHFQKISNGYSRLVKPLLADKKGVQLKQAQRSGKLPKATTQFDGKTIMRFVILIAVGIGLLSNLFSNDDDYYDNSYDYDVEDEFDEDEKYADLDYPDDLDLGFATYFFSKEDRPDSYDEQTDYIERFVSDDARDYFEDYRDRYDELVLDWSDEEEPGIRYARLDESTEAYLFSDQQQQDVILYVKDGEMISRVVGEYWEEIAIADYNELLKVFNSTPENTQAVLSQTFFLLPEEERDHQLSKLREVVTPDVYQELENSYYQPDERELLAGTYQVSRNLAGETVLLFNDNAGELLFIFTLDDYGSVSLIDTSIYDADEEVEIQKNAGDKQPFSKP